MLRSLLLLIASSIAAHAIAQPSATAIATWQLSADNGATWNSNALTLPQTQTSVLARCLVTVNPQGFSGSGPVHFAQAFFETHWRSNGNAGLNDSVSNVQVIRPAIPQATLRSTPSFTSRFGSILKTAGGTTSSPPGSGTPLNALNWFDGLANPRPTSDPIPVFQYTISLDGTIGDRTISGLWRGASLSLVDTAPAGSILVGQYLNVEPDILIAAPITDIPATLTIIPTPTTLALFTITSLFATRRRRP
jgi:hypothetical protein